jgi:fatty-acid desaturase
MTKIENQPIQLPQTNFRWIIIAFLSYAHITALVGISYINVCKWQTIVWSLMLSFWSGIGVTGGAHRLWAHRTYKVWQYGLWSFQAGGTKLERFLHKNQHSQRKLVNF